jgi:hypothetical protein
MKVMVIVKATENTEAGVMPSEQLLRETGAFNEELVQAGDPWPRDGGGISRYRLSNRSNFSVPFVGFVAPLLRSGISVTSRA